MRLKTLQELRQSATEARMRLQEHKTRFRIHPELGWIEWEQKLPFPWNRFDEAPRFEEIPEIVSLQSFLSLFKSSNNSFSDRLSSYIPDQDLTDWLPPFKGSAHLIGLQHYVTFDGRHFEFTAPCTYLLAHDFLNQDFTLAVQYLLSRGKPSAVIFDLVMGDAHWQLDLSNKTVRVGGVERMLPTREQATVAAFQDGKFRIWNRHKGVYLECIVAFEVCTLTLSGNMN